MSMDQVREQRALIEAADMVREAGRWIEWHRAELERWQMIQQHAHEIGATALAAVTESDASDTQD